MKRKEKGDFASNRIILPGRRNIEFERARSMEFNKDSHLVPLCKETGRLVTRQIIAVLGENGHKRKRDKNETMLTEFRKSLAVSVCTSFTPRIQRVQLDCSLCSLINRSIIDSQWHIIPYCTRQSFLSCLKKFISISKTLCFFSKSFQIFQLFQINYMF